MSEQLPGPSLGNENYVPSRKLSSDFIWSLTVLCHELLTQASSLLGCIVFYIFRGCSKCSISLGTLRTRISPQPYHGTRRTNFSRLLKTALFLPLELKKMFCRELNILFLHRKSGNSSIFEFA